MRDIILLLAPSSAGKDYILGELVKRYGWHKMVSYTSRPKRPLEKEGLDYYFRTKEEILEMYENGELFEKTEYVTETDTWVYAFGKKSIKEGVINVCVINPHGLEQFMQSEIKDRLINVLIRCPFEHRYRRYSERLGRPMTAIEKAEAWDRLGRDIEDFSDFHDYDFCVYNPDGCDARRLVSDLHEVIEVFMGGE